MLFVLIHLERGLNCVCVWGGVVFKNVFRPLYRYMSSVSRHRYCGKGLQNLGLYSAPMFFEQIDTSCKTGHLILQSQWKNLPYFVAFLLLAMDTEQTYSNTGQKENALCQRYNHDCLFGWGHDHQSMRG